jgi:hypothetical protein
MTRNTQPPSRWERAIYALAALLASAAAVITALNGWDRI